MILVMFADIYKYIYITHMYIYANKKTKRTFKYVEVLSSLTDLSAGTFA